jgi:protein phosphatase 2C-like protein
VVLDLTHAEVVGRAHFSRHVDCQDATASATTDHGVALALGDGLGTAALSEYGSHAAVHAAVSYALPRIGALPADALVVQAAHAALIAVEECAAELRYSPESVATTLSLAIIDDDSVAVAAVGDGVHIMRDRRGALRRVAMAPGPGYSNLVVQLRVEVVRAEELDGLLLSSDGLDSLLQRRPADAAWPYPPLVHAFLDGDRGGPDVLLRTELRPHTEDDCSIIIAKRRPRPGGELVPLATGGSLRIGAKARHAVGCRYWPALDHTGLRVLKLTAHRPGIEQLAARPPEGLWPGDHAHPRVVWPQDLVLDRHGVPAGLVVRDHGLEPADEEACRAHQGELRVLIELLHSHGLVHGSLTSGHFRITPTLNGTTVMLADCAALFGAGDHDIRRRADIAFVESRPLGSDRVDK